MIVRSLEATDVSELARLLRALMKETFGRDWGGSEDALRFDAFGARFHAAIAVRQRPIGFVAWTSAYDLHHCIAGGSICDMFVEREHRGRGVAIALVAFAARAIKESGGLFVQGQAVEGRENEYARLAMCFPGASCIVGGRAFRTLAELAGQSPRAIARALPEREWNFQA